MDGCSQKLQYRHCNGEKQAEGKGGRVKDNEFSWVKQKTWKYFWNSPFSVSLGHSELHFWFCEPQTRKTTVAERGIQ